MAFVSDLIKDNGLNFLPSNATMLYITTREANTCSDLGIYDIGFKPNILFSLPYTDQNKRKIAVADIYDGIITKSGTASFFAIPTTSNTDLLVTGQLFSPRSFFAGDFFSLESINISITSAISE